MSTLSHKRHTLPGMSKIALSEAQTSGMGKATGEGAIVACEPNLSDLAAILAGSRGCKNCERIAENILDGLLIYSHILIRIQQGNFNLWRAEQINKVQQLLDRERQYVSRYE